MSITLKEIAEMANVSRATVDKVVNNRPGVKKETREKIQAILNEMNYEPNLIGKALVMSKNPLRLGVIVSSEYSAFIHNTLQGIRKAEKELSAFGIEVVVKTLTSFEPAELVSLLNEFQSMKIAGIGLLPIDDDQVRKKLNQLSEAGIGIVTFNSKMDDVNDLCFVGQDHYRGGRIAAGLMEKVVPYGGQIGVIISTHSLSCHQERLEGFRSRISESHKNLTIVDIKENEDRKEDAFRYTLEFCHKYPDLDAIYIAGGGVPGVASALTIEKKEDQVAFICHDLFPENEELLRKGIIDFILDQNSTNQGYQVIKILFNYVVKNKKPQSNFYDIPLDILTRECLR